MYLEIMTMEGHFEKDTNTTSVNKKWSKSKKKTFLRTFMGKAGARTYGAFTDRRQRIRAWPARKFQPWVDSVDFSSGNPPPGAMAPKNTTQYLMDLVYTDQMAAYDVRPVFTMQSHVPHDDNIFSSSDFDYDRSLDFQQRDFENVFFRNEI